MNLQRMIYNKKQCKKRLANPITIIPHLASMYVPCERSRAEFNKKMASRASVVHGFCLKAQAFMSGRSTHQQSSSLSKFTLHTHLFFTNSTSLCLCIPKIRKLRSRVHFRLLHTFGGLL